MSVESRWAAVAALGQSVWYDNVARPALADGHLAQLVDHDRVTGGTSNPTIFSKAVLDSDVYDDELGAAPASDSDAAVFERCWIEDIQRACDLVRPVWERTGGHDGYISIEEEADLAFEVEPAVERARELRALVDRPNVMVKIPGTDAGVEAFRRLTREGHNINMTLLFSRERYRQIAEGYVAALSERVDAGEDVSTIASVASFFVSRIDVQADERLPEDSPLRGRIAVANAKLAYADVFLPSPLRRGVGAARGRRREPAASAVGLDRRQEPRLLADALHRRADRRAHDHHRSRRDARRVPRLARSRTRPPHHAGRHRPRARRSRGAGRSGRRPRRDHHRPGTRRRASSSRPPTRRCSRRSAASASASPCGRDGARLGPAEQGGGGGQDAEADGETEDQQRHLRAQVLERDAEAEHRHREGRVAGGEERGERAGALVGARCREGDAEARAEDRAGADARQHPTGEEQGQARRSGPGRQHEDRQAEDDRRDPGREEATRRPLRRRDLHHDAASEGEEDRRAGDRRAAARDRHPVSAGDGWCSGPARNLPRVPRTGPAWRRPGPLRRSRRGTDLGQAPAPRAAAAGTAGAVGHRAGRPRARSPVASCARSARTRPPPDRARPGASPPRSPPPSCPSPARSRAPPRPGPLPRRAPRRPAGFGRGS